MLKLKALLAKIVGELTGMVVVKTYTKQFSASTWYSNQTIDVALAGYSPIGVQTKSTLAASHFYNSSIEANTLSIGVAIPSGTISTCTITAKVTYIKNTLGGGIALTQVISKVIHFLGGGCRAKIKSATREDITRAAKQKSSRHEHRHCKLHCVDWDGSQRREHNLAGRDVLASCFRWLSNWEWSKELEHRNICREYRVWRNKNGIGLCRLGETSNLCDTNAIRDYNGSGRGFFVSSSKWSIDPASIRKAALTSERGWCYA